MTPPDLASFASGLRWLLSTLAGGFVLVLALWCIGALAGIVVVGFRMVAG
jgi:hypothetical protein